MCALFLVVFGGREDSGRAGGEAFRAGYDVFSSLCDLGLRKSSKKRDLLYEEWVLREGDDGDVGNRYSGFGTEFHMGRTALRCFGKFHLI